MPYDKKTYDSEWKKANMEQINVRVHKGGREKLQLIATLEGKSLNRLILDMLEERYNIEL